VLGDGQLAADDGEIHVAQVVRIGDLLQPHVATWNTGENGRDAFAGPIRLQLLERGGQSFGGRDLYAASARVLERLRELRTQIRKALPESARFRKLARWGRGGAEPREDVLTAGHAASTMCGSCRAASRAARG